MMRLIKDNSNELGIIISSKKNTGNGMSGYTIAHIEPRGLIDRYGIVIKHSFVGSQDDPCPNVCQCLMLPTKEMRSVIIICETFSPFCEILRMT